MSTMIHFIINPELVLLRLFKCCKLQRYFLCPNAMGCCASRSTTASQNSVRQFSTCSSEPGPDITFINNTRGDIITYITPARLDTVEEVAEVGMTVHITIQS